MLDPDQKRHLRYEALRGWEIVDNTARLCAMNLLLHGIGAGLRQPDPRRRRAPADPGERFDMVLTNPPFGKKSSITVVNEEGEAERESAHRRPRRLLGLDHATSSSTSSSTSRRCCKIERPRGHRRARQRAVRGRRGRDGPAQAAARVRRPHAAATADRHLLRAGREGQRAVLRPQAGARDAVDEGALDLRPAHQQALHAEDEPAQARAPRRLRRLLRRATARARRERALPSVHLRRARRARQGEPRHLLAPRRDAWRTRTTFRRPA